MAAGFMTHVTCRLTAKNRDQLLNSTLGNRVWTTFFTFYAAAVVCRFYFSNKQAQRRYILSHASHGWTDMWTRCSHHNDRPYHRYHLAEQRSVQHLQLIIEHLFTFSGILSVLDIRIGYIYVALSYLCIFSICFFFLFLPVFPACHHSHQIATDISSSFAPLLERLVCNSRE